jgi:hypothetical protein
MVTAGLLSGGRPRVAGTGAATVVRSSSNGMQSSVTGTTASRRPHSAWPTMPRARRPPNRSSPLSIERRDVGPHDVRIDIKVAGICHSDIHTARSEWAAGR